MAYNVLLRRFATFERQYDEALRGLSSVITRVDRALATGRTDANQPTLNTTGSAAFDKYLQTPAHYTRYLAETGDPRLEIYRAVMAEVLAAQPGERPRILIDAAMANPDLSGVFNGLARLENALLPGLVGSERSIRNIVERAAELAQEMKHATQQASPDGFKLILMLAESLALCTELNAYENENAYDCEHTIAPHFCQVIETWAQSMENKLRERPEDLPTLRAFCYARAALEELLEWDVLVVWDMESDEDEGSTENT